MPGIHGNDGDEFVEATPRYRHSFDDWRLPTALYVHDGGVWMKVWPVEDAEDSTTNVVDSFEDEDLSEYTFVNGGAGDLGFSSAHATEGGVALVTTDGAGYPDIHSTSGLQNYPAAGQRFRWTATFQNGGSSGGDQDLVIYYGTKDSDNTYYVYIRAHYGNVYLSKNDATGGNEQLESGTLSFSGGTEYYFDLDWGDDGTHTLTVTTGGYDGTQGLQITANDGTYTSGGTGIGTGTVAGEKIWVDDLHTVGSESGADVPSIWGFDATITESASVPEITEFAASTYADGVQASFVSSEELENINCDLSGAVSTTFYAGDFSKSNNGDGTYTYSVQYATSISGDYTFQLNMAADSGGDDGASGQTATTSIEDTTAPTITDFTATVE